MIAMKDIQVKGQIQTSSTDFSITTTVESVSYTNDQKSTTVSCSGYCVARYFPAPTYL